MTIVETADTAAAKRTPSGIMREQTRTGVSARQTTDTAAATRPPSGILREQNLHSRILLCAM